MVSASVSRKDLLAFRGAYQNNPRTKIHSPDDARKVDDFRNQAGLTPEA